ncbi:hypothetical protein RclHR1_07080007 [Rhizophagus clarus]|uniref:Uncharacterized protein n=1 Tax=Rhizophagus clarus TaxID=94130 RepID=A0A2Z6SAV5_9GLOM|nr:hypothetical protein RclHR1_07080007 [Rhizophagus clarus]
MLSWEKESCNTNRMTKAIFTGSHRLSEAETAIKLDEKDLINQMEEMMHSRRSRSGTRESLKGTRKLI